jgi:pyruvate/2-oxoglutarate dehydrogenase complex dihydrolipoamide acyltransferase (E2) component
MKKTIAILIIGLTTAMLGGCTQPASDSNSASKSAASAATNRAAPASKPVTENKNGSPAETHSPTAAPANANGNANASSSTAATAAPDPAKLVGSYIMNQIQKEGVSTMMSQARVEIVFTADGRYSRAVSAKGKTVHNESGQFQIAGDTLTFKITLSNKTINKTPVEKDYTIALSPDGRELKLTSKTGDTAIFYRAQ